MNSKTTNLAIYPAIDISKLTNSKIQLDTMIRLLRDGTYYLVRATYEFYGSTYEDIDILTAVRNFTKYVYETTMLYQISNAVDDRFEAPIDIVDANQESEVDRVKRLVANRV